MCIFYNFYLLFTNESITFARNFSMRETMHLLEGGYQT